MPADIGSRTEPQERTDFFGLQHILSRARACFRVIGGEGFLWSWLLRSQEQRRMQAFFALGCSAFASKDKEAARCTVLVLAEMPASCCS